jgi:hypothetical protein
MSGPFTGLYSDGRFITLPTNIWSGQKYLKETNTLASNCKKLIMVVKVLLCRLHLVGVLSIEPSHVDPFTGLYSNGRFITLPAGKRY